MREMKNSGVEWIGEIPEDWMTGKTIYALQMPITDGPHETPELYDEGVPFVSAEAVSCGNGHIDFDHIRGYISHEFYKECCKKYIPREKDIYMIKSGATTGKVALVEENRLFTIWSPLAVFRCKEEKCYYKYLFYFLQSDAYQKQIENKWTYGTQQNIGMRMLEKLLICFPPIKEQARIAKYLDEKCTRIDVAIEKQQSIIEKLKEYKLSLITESVTRGLNYECQMKDSGIDYIGLIPAHWYQCRLRNIGGAQNGISKGAEYFGEGFPFVSYGDVYRNYSLPYEVQGCVRTTAEEQEHYSVEAGDIFFTRTSETIDEVGFSCVCEKTIPRATYAGFVIRVRPYSNVLYTGYAKYYFRSSHHRSYLAKEMNLVTRASLGQDLLKSMPVLVPPKEEQKVIASFLDEKCDEIDHIISQKESLINKLIDYKKSMVYEAVTGKREVL